MSNRYYSYFYGKDKVVVGELENWFCSFTTVVHVIGKHSIIWTLSILQSLKYFSHWILFVLQTLKPFKLCTVFTMQSWKLFDFWNFLSSLAWSLDFVHLFLRQNIQPLDFVDLRVLGITCETQLLGARPVLVLRGRVKATDSPLCLILRFLMKLRQRSCFKSDNWNWMIDKAQRVKCCQMLDVSYRPMRNFTLRIIYKILLALSCERRWDFHDGL